MRIAAIWIEEHVIIKNQFFNFGGKVDFKFQFDPEKRSLYIEGQNNENYVDLFENYKNISSVTGLIGMNGCGKTTILKMFNTIEAELPFALPIVFVMEHDEGKEKMEYSIITYYSNKKLTDRQPIDIQLPDKGIVSLDRLQKEEVEITDDINPFYDCQILFYSSLYSSQNDKYLSEYNPRNRSVQYRTLLELSPEKLSNQLDKFEQDKKNKVIYHEASFNVLRPYFHNRLKLQIYFLTKLQTEHKDLIKRLNGIKFPDKIRIDINRFIFEKSKQLMARSHYRGFGKIQKLNEHCFHLIAEEKDLKISLKNEITIVLFNYCFAYDFFQQGGPSLVDLEKFISETELDENIFNSIRSYMIAQTRTNDRSDLGKSIRIFDELDSLTNNVEITKDDGLFNFASYDLKLNERGWQFLDKFLDIGYNLEDSFMNFSWIGLSAGEEGLLTQFTELYHGIREVESNSCLISIDEGELFLHAEWQRKYLFSLVEFINHFMGHFHDDVKAQLILTSHSSFIPSDLTRDNLVFFEKNKETGLIRINNSFKHEATLGGNLFNLLSNSFYLDDFIGEFGKRKIQGFLEELYVHRDSGRKISLDNYLTMEKKINSVGDELIRNRMLEILNMIPSEYEDVEAEIEKLKRQLKALEQKKKK